MILDIQSAYTLVKGIIFRPKPIIAELIIIPGFSQNAALFLLTTVGACTALLDLFSLSPYKLTAAEVFYEIAFDSTRQNTAENQMTRAEFEAIVAPILSHATSADTMWDEIGLFSAYDYGGLDFTAGGDILTFYPLASALNDFVYKKYKVRYAEDFAKLITNDDSKREFTAAMIRLDVKDSWTKSLLLECLPIIPSFLLGLLLWIFFRGKITISAIVGISLYLFSVILLVQSISLIILNFIQTPLFKLKVVSEFISIFYMQYWVTYALPEELSLSRIRLVVISTLFVVIESLFILSISNFSGSYPTVQQFNVVNFDIRFVDVFFFFVFSLFCVLGVTFLLQMLSGKRMLLAKDESDNEDRLFPVRMLGFSFLLSYGGICVYILLRVLIVSRTKMPENYSLIKDVVSSDGYILEQFFWILIIVNSLYSGFVAAREYPRSKKFWEGYFLFGIGIIVIFFALPYLPGGSGLGLYLSILVICAPSFFFKRSFAK